LTLRVPFLIRPRHTGPLALFFAVWINTCDASASPECSEDRKHLRVVFPEQWPAEVQESILSDLSSSLSPQHLFACTHQGETHASAVATLTFRHPEDTSIRIEIADSLTQKQVARDIAIEELQAGATPLVIAVAADELLRATWAELSLRKPRQHEQKEPEVAEPKTDPTKPERETPTETAPIAPSLFRQGIALRLATDAYLGASTFWGADLSYLYRPSPIWELHVTAGPRVATQPSVSSRGAVNAQALALGVETHYLLLRSGPASLAPLVSIQGTRVHFEGRPNESSFGQSFNAWTLSLGAGLHFQYLFDRIRFGVQSQLGAPLLAARVTDGDNAIGGVFGMQWSSSVSTGVMW